MKKQISIKEQVARRNAGAPMAGVVPTRQNKLRGPADPAPNAENARAEHALRYWARIGLPETLREYRFHPERKWRFDFAWPSHPQISQINTDSDQKNLRGSATSAEKSGGGIAVEVQGGNFKCGGGAHARGGHLRKEYEKWRAAAELGWRILPVLPEELLGLAFTEQLQRILNNKGAK